MYLALMYLTLFMRPHSTSSDRISVSMWCTGAVCWTGFGVWGFYGLVSRWGVQELRVAGLASGFRPCELEPPTV